MTKFRTVSIHEPLYARLQAAAKADGRSVANYTERLLTVALGTSEAGR